MIEGLVFQVFLVISNFVSLPSEEKKLDRVQLKILKKVPENFRGILKKKKSVDWDKLDRVLYVKEKEDALMQEPIYFENHELKVLSEGKDKIEKL